MPPARIADEARSARYLSLLERRRIATLRERGLSVRSMRKRRRRADERSIRFLTPSKLIDERPQVVDQRLRIGDFEGDLIIGRSSRSAIGTLVDRRSRYLRLVHLPHGHGAEAFAAAALDVLTTIPEQARPTLTWDRDVEMAHHDLLAELFAEGIYFAPPASPWMHGSNENTYW